MTARQKHPRNAEAHPPRMPGNEGRNLNIEYDEIFQEYDVEKLKSITDKIIEICSTLNEM